MKLQKAEESPKMENGDNAEMDNMLCDLIDIHMMKSNEEALQRVIQSLYSELNNSKEARFGTKLYDNLISAVIADRECVHVNPEYVSKVLGLHARQYPRPGLFLLRKLSSISLCEGAKEGAEEHSLQLHPHAGQVLEHLLDDFVRELGLGFTCSPQLFAVIQKLLQAALSENRIITYSKMRKLLLNNCKCVDHQKEGPQVREALKCVEPHWPEYITIMKQLEHDESHLVLPMISGHLPRFTATSQQYRDWLQFLHWLRSMPPHRVKTLRLKICSKIKALQHETLRFEAKNRMFEMFEPTIDVMRALCSNSDNFCRDHKRFTAKIANCNNIEEELVHFDKSLYVILYRSNLKIGIALHKKISQLPKNHHGWLEKLEDESILNSLIAYIKQYPDSVFLLVLTIPCNYVTTHWSVEESYQILNDFLEAGKFLNVSILFRAKSVPTSLLIRGILSGNPVSGDKCIQYSLINQYNYFFTSFRQRDSYMNFGIGGKTDTHLLLTELLRINNDKKQEYGENSKDHRIKMRIARALLRITFMGPSFCSDHLCQALLAPNERHNIRYMYEYLLARCLPNVNVLQKHLKQLPGLKALQQLDCIIIYNVIRLEQLQRIIDLLLPVTKIKQFEFPIRLFAQLVLHRLLLQLESYIIKIPGVTNMRVAIESSLGDKLLECHHEVRLLLPKICYQTPDGRQAGDFTLYMTCAPCDEYGADAL